ncbi:YncE family protein [Streptomyces sp. NPDC023723]|uniref:YncE family protein n=1 Tax=Streptomyces sp. NPDC023723 TaxID=3154323 RepID=UPI0033DDBB25
MQPSSRAGRAGDVLAVVDQSGPTVSFHDAADDRWLGALDVLAEPHELCFDPVRRLLWCTVTYRSGYYHANSGRRTELIAIDPGTREVAEIVDLAPEHAPHGLALDAARGRLYVTVEGSADRSGGVVVIDTATRRPVGRIDTGAPGAHWIAIDAAGRTGCVASKEAPFVSVVDLERGVLTGKAAVPGSEGVAISADGAHAFVAAPYSGSFAATGDASVPGIRVVDTRTASVVDLLVTDDRIMPVHLTSQGLLLVGEVRADRDPANGSARMTPGRLVVFDAGTRERLGAFEVGHCPLTITSSPDGRLAYVACYASSTVHVVDLHSMRDVTRLDIGGPGAVGAHGLAYLPRTG